MVGEVERNEGKDESRAVCSLKCGASRSSLPVPCRGVLGPAELSSSAGAALLGVPP